MDSKAHKTFLVQLAIALFFALFIHPLGANAVELQRRWSHQDLAPYVKKIKREIFQYQRCLENSLGCSACQWLKKNTSKGKHVASRKEQLLAMITILSNPNASDWQKIEAILKFLGTIKSFAKFQGDAGRNFLEAMEKLERDFFTCQRH